MVADFIRGFNNWVQVVSEHTNSGSDKLFISAAIYHTLTTIHTTGKKGVLI